MDCVQHELEHKAGQKVQIGSRKFRRGIQQQGKKCNLIQPLFIVYFLIYNTNLLVQKYKCRNKLFSSLEKIGKVCRRSLSSHT